MATSGANMVLLGPLVPVILGATATTALGVDRVRVCLGRKLAGARGALSMCARADGLWPGMSWVIFHRNSLKEPLASVWLMYLYLAGGKGGTSSWKKFLEIGGG
jgi:hypothetical protein